MIAVCSDISTKHINPFCGHKFEFFNVELGGTQINHWILVSVLKDPSAHTLHAVTLRDESDTRVGPERDRSQVPKVNQGPRLVTQVTQRQIR